MYPFWDVAIWPILQAARARRVVEIGALRGETTALMLDKLGPDAELHVIDPVPEFDPTEHERRFPGRYLFYREISHDVLPRLPAVDAALVDGDHNWFTVYHELKMLADASRRDGALLPVLILHDVCWPYGRRDLYYGPDRVPEEFRQPYAQQGIRPGTKKLLPSGGLNPTMYNAELEGGERNGVMTAVDDFVKEFERPLRCLVLPIYFGLAIVVEEARLEQQPELARVLAWLESLEGKDKLLELAESTRLQAMIFQHNVFFHRERMLGQAADRYLNLLEAALLDELYLDHEARLLYLAECARENRDPNLVKMRDPVRDMKLDMKRLTEERRSGLQPGSGYEGSRLPYTDIGRVRLAHLRDCLDHVRSDAIAGDLVECGTGRGGAAIYMRGYLDAHNIEDRSLWIADRFRWEPHPEDALDVVVDLNAVREGFSRFGLLDDRVQFLQGPPGESLAGAPIERVALLRVGANIGEDAGAALDALYDRLAIGGVVVVDDYLAPSTQRAVDELRARLHIAAPIERTAWSGASWRKSESDGHPAAEIDATPRLAGPAPAAGSDPTAQKDLSVVVVFYNMRREAARTLYSLSRAYQRGVEDLDYEVIVVENGSAPDQLLGEELVGSFGPEFRYLDLGADATPTPADALNRGLAIATGESIAFMIDGAHVLTPGVLRYGIAGLGTYAPAIVATQQWYVGPGQQPDAMLHGYDQTYEDRLFDQIQWPVEGYRLFDIGHFIGERDWLDGMWESNCIFVPRKLLEQYGAFDEAFAMPGGGYANLDFYERVASAPGVNVVTILGEGSFHQQHGGTTTNTADADDRRGMIFGYAAHYAELRGRTFKGHGKTFHYVGTMFPSALRTRARRMSADAFFQARAADAPDAPPSTPIPIPDEVRTQFIEAFWRSLAWRDTKWLGRRVMQPPTDLIAYQEIIERVAPDWIIETGTGNGARALFLASMCELLDRGHVISIDAHPAPNRPQHPRLTYIEGPPHADVSVQRVREIVGAAPRALVVLGSRPGTAMRMEGEFNAYEQFVPAGSYVVMENTIVNGHPVWPSFGPGPMEAVKRLLAARGDFAVDPTFERYGLTFNPSGYLKRLR